VAAFKISNGNKTAVRVFLKTKKKRVPGKVLKWAGRIKKKRLQGLIKQKEKPRCGFS